MALIKSDRISLYFPISRQSKFSSGSAPKNLIRIKSKEYIRALHDISFSLNQGQRLGIVGRNGSGKSTLLRVLGQVYSPTSGSLATEGKISSLFNLILGTQGELTGRENIVIRGLIKGLSRREIAEHEDEIVRFSELKDFIDLPMRTYSEGMRMRLLFAIATAFSPEILLLDEWIGAGDASFQKKAAARMNSLVERAGITVIASHNKSLLRNVCDTGMWLDQGVMRAFGPIDDVFAEMEAHLDIHQTRA
jgi:ABC-type polysaccharide/polyol phosphate transport system ATPase subunit